MSTNSSYDQQRAAAARGRPDPRIQRKEHWCVQVGLRFLRRTEGHAESKQGSSGWTPCLMGVAYLSFLPKAPREILWLLLLLLLRLLNNNNNNNNNASS